MAFVQQRLDRVANTSRDIFNVYVYRPDNGDTFADMGEAGYFAEARFGDELIRSGYIHVYSADEGYGSYFLNNGVAQPITGGLSSANFGFLDYNDVSTAATPTALVAGVWTDIPNDGLGAFTNKTYRPDDVNEVLDTSTGYLDFSELPLGSEINVRNDFTITPQTNNALFEARFLLGTGAGQYALQFWSERLDSGSGIPYQRVTSFPIYIGDSNTKDNAGRMQVRLSTSGTLVNAGVYVSIRAE